MLQYLIVPYCNLPYPLLYLASCLSGIAYIPQLRPPLLLYYTMPCLNLFTFHILTYVIIALFEGH